MICLHRFSQTSMSVPVTHVWTEPALTFSTHLRVIVTPDGPGPSVTSVSNHDQN